MQRRQTALFLMIALLASPVSAARAQEETGPSSDIDTPVPAKGIWIGSLALCDAGPVKAETRIDANDGLPVVNIALSALLRDALAELTAANIGKPLPIRVDGKVVSAPNVNEPIRGGELQISGLDKAEADRIVASLQACAG